MNRKQFYLLALLLIVGATTHAFTYKLKTVYTISYKNSTKKKYKLQSKAIKFDLSKDKKTVVIVEEVRKRETTKVLEDKVSVEAIKEYVTFVDGFLGDDYAVAMKAKKESTLYANKGKDASSLFILFRKKNGKSIRKDGIVIVLAGRSYNIDKTKLLSLNKRFKKLIGMEQKQGVLNDNVYILETEIMLDSRNRGEMQKQRL